MQNRRPALPEGGPVMSAPKGAKDIELLLGEAIAHVMAGRMDPKVGTSLSYMSMAFLKSLEVADLEPRIKALEEELTKREAVVETVRALPKQPERTPEEWDQYVKEEYEGPSKSN